MTDVRANPDDLLKMIQNETTEKERGQLKIFFGYAAGVGKTYSMLKAAHAAKRHGMDVVSGYVEPHARPQTAALLKGLEQIPYKKINYKNIELREFDLDAVIKRNPQLVLVDELAHTNAKGCRHAKRYQDVEELLKAGINVYTTVNVQHIESLNDMVTSITGVIVRERIPDKVFDNATQVELVDIEPQDLIERLTAGKIYKESQAQKALSNFFSTENLIALREIALRRCADRVNKISDMARLKSNSEYFTDEHILVCLSSSPTNPKIIRTAARMAHAFKGTFTALFVETPEFSSMSKENQKRLRSNTHLAEQLGATIETTYGDDPAFQIAEFARLSGVSKIVVGRNNVKRKYFFSMPSLTERLTDYSPNLDVYIIPDTETALYKEKKKKLKKEQFVPMDILKSLLILFVATIIGFFFYQFGFSEANIMTVYILGVLFTSLVTTQRIYSLISSIVSVLIFNYLFTGIRFSFRSYDSGYPATFLTMFLSAFITGTLAVKLKQHARQSAQTAYRTKVLLDTNQLLQQAKEKDRIIDVTAKQLIKLLDKDIVFYTAEGDALSKPRIFPIPDHEDHAINKDYITVNEQAVAAWVFKNNKHAGATTDTLSNSKCLYLAIRVNNNVYGVVGIVINNSPLDSFENSIVLSMLGECALALENEQVAAEKEQAAILAKNEQLRANLLRSISHDLRTPLTSISGNAGVLLSSENALSPQKKRELYNDIYEDSLWLINLVENLLSVTRIEDGTMHLTLTAELIDEVIRESLHHINRKSVDYLISYHEPDEYLLAKMDARLIVQVLINLIDNAIKYTPKGSSIIVSTYKQDDYAVIEVADNGPGIPAEAKPRIFEIFYTASAKTADSRRGLGLGLTLCKSIVNAHGGEITVLDNKPCGTIFRFTLPAKEVKIYE